MKFEFVEYHRKVTDEELKNDLKRVSAEFNKEIITQKEYNENGKFHCDTISDRFGSWNNALRSFVEYINSDEKPYGAEVVVNACVEKTGHKTARDVNLRLRFLVMKRDSFKCVMCGASPAFNP